jgi:hypothetical protein
MPRDRGGAGGSGSAVARRRWALSGGVAQRETGGRGETPTCGPRGHSNGNNDGFDLNPKFQMASNNSNSFQTLTDPIRNFSS